MGFRLSEMVFSLFMAGVVSGQRLVPGFRYRQFGTFEAFIEQELKLSPEMTQMMVRVWERFYAEGGLLRGFNTRLRLDIARMYHISRVARTVEEANSWLQRAAREGLTATDLDREIRQMVSDMRGNEPGEVTYRTITFRVSTEEYQRYHEFLAWSVANFGNATRNGVHVMRALDHMRDGARRRPRRT